jgi:uncharacterized membrane protein YfcA
MPVVTPTLAAMVFAAGAAAGGIGALLGIGGGVFLVPFLNLGLNLPFTAAAAISLTTVIATSSAVSAGAACRPRLINLRLGMVLEVATVAGSLLGGATAHLFAQTTLQQLFGATALVVALVTLGRIRQRNIILDPLAEPGLLGNRFHDDETGGDVTYQVKRLPVALAASFVAGNISSLLGVGGGIVKVPALNAWCGVPLRAAAATSAFMIGVTATGGAVIYYGRGQLMPALAAAAVLGVQCGSWVGLRTGPKASIVWLKGLMAAVLFIVSALMFIRSVR